MAYFMVVNEHLPGDSFLVYITMIFKLSSGRTIFNDEMDVSGKKAAMVYFKIVF